MKVFFVSRFIYYFYVCMVSLWRKKLIEPDELKADLKFKRPVIFAHWHGDEIVLTHLVKRYGLCTMTSTSKDGQIIDYVIHKLGGATSKGSSTRGAVGALKGLIRLCRGGRPASLAVDGPQGPYHKVKPGVLELAKVTGAKIYATGVACSKAHVFEKSWNKIFIPYPFAKVVVVYTNPLVVGRDDSPKDPALSEKLEKSLQLAQDQALHHIAST